MDKIFVGMSTVDKVVPHGLVHPRAYFRKLYVVPYSGINGYIYVDYHIIKAE